MVKRQPKQAGAIAAASDALPVPAIAETHDLAWAGQHDQALTVAAAAVGDASSQMTSADRLALHACVPSRSWRSASWPARPKRSQ